MAKQKILSMPLRVAPSEMFELVIFVVNVEYDSYGYDPMKITNAGDITYKIYDSSGALIKSGSFDNSPTNGLAITKDNIAISNLGTYAVYYEWAALKAYGFSQIYVSSPDEKIIHNLDTSISSRASQTSVNDIKAQTDKLQFDANDYVKANVQDKGVLNDPSVSEIADAVWDEPISGHTIAGSFGAKNQRAVPSEDVDDYKADVSNLALESTAQAIKNKTDNLTFSGSNVQARVNDKGVLNDLSITDVENAVYEANINDHTSANSFGKLFNTLLDIIKKIW